MIAEQDSDGEGADETRKNRSDRILWRGSLLDFPRDEVADDLRVGLAFERPPFGDQLVAERLEILDDAVVDQRNGPDDVRMRVADGRSAVRRPTRVGDPRDAVKRVRLELSREIVELAFRPAPNELPLLDRANARRVIA